MDGSEPVITGLDPNRVSSMLCGSITNDGKGLEWLQDRLRNVILHNSLRVHHPRNFGHQVAPPLPIAALFDLVSATTNQAMAVYEAGPAATVIEKHVIDWMSAMVGWDLADGVLTSGGSQANLTALLAARQIMSERDVWSEGVGVAGGLRIIASEHVHYSVSRSAGIMGLGTNAVLKVPVDSEGRMRVDDLAGILAKSRTKGEFPFAVVATAGCTPTGSIDPLREIGKFCRAHDLWFHVDGAHGASGLLSSHLRQHLDGIEMADSLVWDGHKLLYMPATVSAVLFRNGKDSYSAFSQQASYLFQGDDQESEAYNIGYRTLECTKRMMGFKLWATLSVFGTTALSAVIEHVYRTASEFADLVSSMQEFELLMRPQTNIVCFRPSSLPIMPQPESNAYVSEVRARVVQSGDFHLTQTDIHGETWFRVAIMNPWTTIEDLKDMLQAVREEAAA